MTQQDVGALDTGVGSFAASGSEVHGPRATPPEALLVTAYLLLLSGMLIWSLVQLWPGPTPAGGTVPTTSEVGLLFFTVNISDEVRLLLLVVFTGALGGIIHAVRSITWYIGQQELRRNWLLTYIAQPFVGSTLAFLFYLVVRGGFFSPQASFQQTSPFGFAAMAGMIGMFSPQAVLKLKDVAEIILTKPPAGKDTAPQAQGPTTPQTTTAIPKPTSAANGTSAAPHAAPYNQVPQ
ncbi:MAG: hypothetical protein NVSMB2_02700 [Chloroflexota bacterium]